MKYYKKLLITNYNYWPECDIFLDIINEDDFYPSVKHHDEIANCASNL